MPNTKTHKLWADLSLTASGGATPSGTSRWIDTKGAKSIAWTIDHTITGHASSSLTAIIETSPNGVDPDSDAYDTMTLADNQQYTRPVALGPRYMRVKITNGDAVNATHVAASLNVDKD